MRTALAAAAARRPEAIETVDPADAEQMGTVLDALTGPGPDRVDDPQWVARAREAWNHLPVAVRSVLRRHRRDSGDGGTLVLRGLPVGGVGLPATPAVAGSAQLTPTRSAAALVTLATGLGDPFAFRREKAGHLVQDVVPVPGLERTQSNAGSERLTFHTENAFHHHRPDAVLLLCLRADHEQVAGLRTASSR